MPQETTLKVILERFDNSTCPCLWIITTPKHSKKDCPHYTFSAERAFITHEFTSLLKGIGEDLDVEIPEAYFANGALHLKKKYFELAKSIVLNKLKQ